MSTVPCHDLSWPGDWVREAVARAESALRAGHWEVARARFEAVLADAEAPEALEGLATAAWNLGEGDASWCASERAYLLYRRESDLVGAARVAAQLAWRHTTRRDERAIANGWAGRARRLLEGQRLTPVHGWLTLLEGAQALFLDDDPALAHALGGDTLQVGQALGRVDLEIGGVALEGAGLVSEGNVVQGMRRLDEAGAAVMAGEVADAMSVELVASCVMEGCVRANDARRATRWHEQLQGLAAHRRLPALFALSGRDQPQGPVSQEEGKPDLQTLTTREREVLDLVSKGLTNRNIADRLVLSEHTVHRHVANIRDKLRVHTRAAAVANATREL